MAERTARLTDRSKHMTNSRITANTARGHLMAAADRFKPGGEVVDIRKYGNGNVHHTFLVTLDSAREPHFILQHLNTHVFRQPELVMQNMRVLTEHVHDRLRRAPLGGRRRWEVPRVIVAQDGRNFWIDPDGSFWRAMSFIEAAHTHETVRDAEHAGEVGYALGMFHHLISDLPTDGLADTLEGFHITPGYLRHYDEVLVKSRASGTPEVNYATRIVSERRAWAHVLEHAKTQGKLRIRPIHGDPKVNNVLFDDLTRQAVSIVDLDTVKPGLIHYDIGDCLRSCCNSLGEETAHWESVHFEPDLCRAILQGYLTLAGGFLTENDYIYLFDAIRLIAFELGLRFFTDHLEGNVYFKVRHQEHNLARALVQFKLTESIESQAASIRAIIGDLR
jgi:Ser/Thr protein kinase RdoA (MazF antagonist)